MIYKQEIELLNNLRKQRENNLLFGNGECRVENILPIGSLQLLKTKNYKLSEFTENTDVGDFIRTELFGDLLITEVYGYSSPIKYRYCIHYTGLDKDGKYYTLKLNRKKRYDTTI